MTPSALRPGERHSEISQPARETLILVASAVVGTLVVVLVLFADGAVGTPGWADYTPERREALRQGAWSLWVALVVGQGALWAIALLLLLRGHERLRAELSGRDLLVTLGPLVLLSAAVDVVRYAAQVQSPLPGHFGKVTVVTWLGTLVALVAVAGLVRIGRAGWRLQGRRDPATLDEYLHLRRELRQFLVVAGAVVAGAVLTAGALQSAVEGYDGQSGRPEAVLLYGLFLTMLLAAVYAPVYSAVQQAGELLVEDLASRRPAAGEPDEPPGSARRSELRAQLELDTGVVESMRVGIAVLAPLASGIVSLLLPS